MSLHNQHFGCGLRVLCCIPASREIIPNINSLDHTNPKGMMSPCPSEGGSVKKPQEPPPRALQKRLIFFPPRKYRFVHIIYHLSKGPCVRTTGMIHVFVLKAEPRTLSTLPLRDSRSPNTIFRKQKQNKRNKTP